MAHRSHPPGFSLIEVIVALAILLILAAVALPTLSATVDQARIDTTAAQLQAVRNGLYDPASNGHAFFQEVGANAGRLSELSSVIVANNANYATGTDDSCGRSFRTSEVNRWIANGPFVNFNIDRNTGLATAIGNAADSLTRIPNDDDPGVLRINFINSVDVQDAKRLDATIDGANGASSGAVQWLAPAADGVVTMYYFIPINDEC
ncbi:MAG TPA: prepilin-type N-terminal cleavage/methylation domain-containing protein [Gemmatimonadaceae bacterium]|nr:prepilin-type N-terminal cleavage/methylation domain-containing protein [Gemmatimonadaceae bacterium]